MLSVRLVVGDLSKTTLIYRWVLSDAVSEETFKAATEGRMPTVAGRLAEVVLEMNVAALSGQLALLALLPQGARPRRRVTP